MQCPSWFCANPGTHEKSCEVVASGAKGPDSHGSPNLPESGPQQGHSHMVEEVMQQWAKEEAMETVPPLLDWRIDKVA